MEFAVRTTALAGHADQALVLLVPEGEDPHHVLESVGRGPAAAYTALRDRQAFAGKAGRVRVLQGSPRDRYPTVVLARVDSGSGARGLAEAAATGARHARDHGARSLTVPISADLGPAPRPTRAASAIAEGVWVGLYRFQAHKTEKAKVEVERVTFLAPRGRGDRVKKAVEHGRIVGEAVLFARDLGNEPANHATPTYLAETALEIAGEHGLVVRILDEDEMRALGMGALLGVSSGSAEPAKLIVLTYEPPRRARDTVAIVGKGVTFDSGGISIKPAAKMDEMKFDMCGGAAILATMQALPRLGATTRVVGLVPASENLSGSAAYKPGDILKAMNGTTIEVKNTDAEGRLILADALAYATSRLRPKPKAIVDLATLTGSCVVALGDQYAGLVSNDDRLAARVIAAGETSGDLVWRLPLNEGYRSQLESAYADVSNLGSPGAGTITAAAFLEKFVGRTPWVHLDIAGTAWTDKGSGFLTRGATGFGVRLLLELLPRWSRGGA